ncbi:hypothetical protein ABZ815_39355 [Nonomuraea sp. NPDC047529]|uniref:hypothetical protein n=1 Tax=Nonomuraea sp. NPDC047529 TaxID=3155623 RepID=UPI0033D832C3
MSNRLQVAFAVLAGYYLGRRHKLRMAAALAAAGLAGRASCGEGGLLAQGVKALSSNPELQRMTGRLRGELMEVGKAAAVSAASRQIDSLTHKLQEHGGKSRAEQDEAKPAKQQAPRGEEADYDEEDYDESDRYDEDEDEEATEEPEQAGQQPEGHRGQRRTRPVRRVSQSRR